MSALNLTVDARPQSKGEEDMNTNYYSLNYYDKEAIQYSIFLSYLPF